MTRTELLNNIAKVEHLANGTKWTRLSHNPIKYASAMFFKKIIYPLVQQEKLTSVKIFSGKKMIILLPAATDIYITGGKSHCSEISLAKFLIHNLKEGETFWDIGAHYGYFSSIAADLVGANGCIVAIEASATTFAILQQNIASIPNATCFRNAISNINEPITFYELPNKYSEYNSTDMSQFENEAWFQKIKTQKQVVDALTLDQLLFQTEHRAPQIIKIDVEGGEFAAIDGARKLLTEHNPLIVMEYLEAKRNNLSHRQALEVLLSFYYTPHTLDINGNMHPVADVEAYLSTHNLDSDNIVFKKINSKLL